MALDLTPFTLFWADEFTELKLSDASTRGTANWHTQQIGGGGFGSATFMGAASGIFSIVTKGDTASALEIKMRRNASGGLESGLICNIFPDGSSAANQIGPKCYAEARLWLPDPIPGVWPAFWTKGKGTLNPNRTLTPELDILEWYGPAAPYAYSTTLHAWRGNTSNGGHTEMNTAKTPGDNVMFTGWHTYGLEIGEGNSQTYYFDREPYLFISGDTSSHYRDTWDLVISSDPLAYMFNFAAGGGWPIDPELGTTKPASFWVDYFRIYSKEPPVVVDFETDFTVTPTGADITVVPGITRINGPVGALTVNADSGVDSNMTDLTGICYLLPSTGSPAQFIQARIESVDNSSGPLLCVRAADHANWVGVRWTTTAIELVRKVNGGAALIPNGRVTGQTNTVGDIIRLEIDAANNARVLINGVEKIAPVPVNAPTLTAQTPGLIPRTVVKPSWIDDLSSGPL